MTGATREGRLAVAIPAAMALGAVGAMAAERMGVSSLLGIGAGSLAALLTVLALPSVPTRRSVVLLLVAGGLGVLRHASGSSPHRSALLVVWAAASLVTLVVLERLGAESMPTVAGARPFATRGREVLRASVLVGVVATVAVAIGVPLASEHLGRSVVAGREPGVGDVVRGAASLRTTEELDMTTRPRLTDRVVFTVEAERPDFWRGETFDTWDGQRWRRSDARLFALRRPSPTTVLVPALEPGAERGEDLRQTFRFEGGFSNLVFAAPSARIVETDRYLRARADGSVFVAGLDANAFGQGAVYTVTSRRIAATEADLRAATGAPLPDWLADRYLAVPAATSARVQALARRLAAPLANRYDRIRAFEAWLGENTTYSIDAPTAPPGTDVVDDFLFRSRIGWCEQIASSLVVMARSVGIPARLATGFVPGMRDPLTGRFVVRERDAHAWAEIWFPGIGWQGFDPTAAVPLAGEAVGDRSWSGAVRRALPALAVVGGLALGLALVAPAVRRRGRMRRTRAASWGATTLHRLERVGRRVGRRRRADETAPEYVRALADRLEQPELVAVGAALDSEAFSPGGVTSADRREAERLVSSAEAVKGIP
ncbi:MAG: transglutaminaseTgpA domain-containing protein [Actinomycetota bacterium]